MSPAHKNLFGTCALWLTVLVALSVAACVYGQDASSQDLVTRVFDIRALLLEVPDYRAVFSDLRSDDLYGAGTVLRRAVDASAKTKDAKETKPFETQRAEINAERLMQIIADVVYPDSWQQAGGWGALHHYGGQLVVANRTDVIMEVERLLNLLKASTARRIQVDAYFIIPVEGSDNRVLDGFIEHTKLEHERFHGLIEARKDQITVAHVALTGFDGQRVAITSGRQINVIAGMVPVVQERVSVYDPVVRQLIDGVTVEVQPVVDEARNTVLVDLRASLGEPLPALAPESRRAAGAPAQQPPSKQKTTETTPASLSDRAPSEMEKVLALESAQMAMADVERAISPYQVNELFTAFLNGPSYRVVHFANSASLPVDSVSLVGVARYDQSRDVLLFVRPSVR